MGLSANKAAQTLLGQGFLEGTVLHLLLRMSVLDSPGKWHDTWLLLMSFQQNEVSSVEAARGTLFITQGLCVSN